MRWTNGYWWLHRNLCGLTLGLLNGKKKKVSFRKVPHKMYFYCNTQNFHLNFLKTFSPPYISNKIHLEITPENNETALVYFLKIWNTHFYIQKKNISNLILLYFTLQKILLNCFSNTNKIRINHKKKYTVIKKNNIDLLFIFRIQLCVCFFFS